MASANRASSETVALLQSLEETPYKFNFFQALRLIEAANPGMDPGPREAVVTFWVVSTPAGEGIAAALLESLRRWLAEDWEFESVSFAVRRELVEQVRLFHESGLADHRRIFVAARDSEFSLYR